MRMFLFPRLLPRLLPARLAPRAFLVPGVLASLLFLAACEDPKDKAERHFQSGMALLEDGDVDRALIEFRNVIKYDGFHKEARQNFATIQLERGRVNEAYGEFLRLIEQHPDTPEVRRILADIAMGRQDWREVERHGRAAIELEPDDSGSKALSYALDYRQGLLDDDKGAQDTAARAAEGLLDEVPDNLVARRIVIAYTGTGPNPQTALPHIDAAIDQQPGSLEFHTMKLRLLALLERDDAAGEQLRTMFELFPENEETRRTLISWYLNRRDYDGAEAFLRDLTEEDTGDPTGHVAVVQFLQAARGVDAALAELDRLTAANDGNANSDLYRALAATIRFEQGTRDAAITEMEDVLADAPPSDQTRRIKSMLARMLITTGNQVGARARVEEILDEDTTNVDALKMRASWLINEDRPGDAIIDLRSALGQAPRDAEALTLMAQAHERDGSIELAGERLALAVQVSDAAPTESLRYARFLQRDGRVNVAESVLIDARQASPQNVDIMVELARIWLTREEYAGVQRLLRDLRALDGNARAQTAAQSIQAALLLQQQRIDDSLAVLQSQAAANDGDVAAVAQILQTQVRAGKTAEARTYIDSLLQDRPDNDTLKLLSASLYATMDQPDDAAEIFRALIAENPDAEVPVRLLHRLLRTEGKTDDASAVLQAGIDAIPGSVTLRVMKAGELEARGDIEGAIDIYEAIYTEDSNNIVVANNLASLITTFRDDEDSLNRAFVVARRLRGSRVPAFQDTYGWIEYRRGNLDEALSHLEPAAVGLPGEALVQYHLGMTYAALDRPDQAIAQLERALELGLDSDLPQMDAARAALQDLRAGPAPSE